MQDEIYYFVGKAIVLSILNGGPGPTFFSPLIVEYLFRGMADMKQPCVSDVPDPELRDKISMVWEGLLQNKLILPDSGWDMHADLRTVIKRAVLTEDRILQENTTIKPANY